MNDEFEQLVKQLQRMDVELPVHQQTLRKQLLKIHASHDRTSRHQPFYARRRMSTMMTAKRILPVGMVVVLVGVLMLGWLWLSPGSGGPSDRRRLAEHKDPHQTSGTKVAGASNLHQNQDTSRPPNNSSANEGDDSAVASASAPKTMIQTSGHTGYQASVTPSNIQTETAASNKQVPENTNGTEDNVVIVVLASAATDKTIAKIEKTIAKAEAKAEKAAAKALKKQEKNNQ